ncbi:hypothetical protein F9B74_00630 [Pelistega sp. NLN82]|uniref:Uncharacterized protein n=1 Tax=Pelistega ratti TaxID=2652177 RepID=A0A6L9Y4D7_9BURK|nr:hypothetical protein [Pelistega ratti]NEN74837.1 hypothetical protein [Pelistega ratti]
MWLYLMLGVGLVLATLVFHWLIWNLWIKPKLNKYAQEIEQQVKAQEDKISANKASVIDTTER